MTLKSKMKRIAEEINRIIPLDRGDELEIKSTGPTQEDPVSTMVTVTRRGGRCNYPVQSSESERFSIGKPLRPSPEIKRLKARAFAVPAKA